MSQGEAGQDRGASSPREDRDRRGERIGVGAGDDSVTRIQLAARWAESYAPEADSLGGALKRFRLAYEYLDAVIHGIEPQDLEPALAETPTAHAPVPAPSYAPPPPAPAPPPQAEPRPWG
jgi:hypothetical protein